jgi:zinc protease
MVLAVAGDLTEKQLRAWAQESFGGDWGRPAFAGPVPRAVEPAAQARRVFLREDEVKEAYLHVSFPAVAVDHPDTPALDVLAMIAGQGEASRLNLDIKRKRQLVNDIYAYAYTPKDPGLVSLSLTLPAEKLSEALRESMRVLLGMRHVPVEEDELATVKGLMESEAIYQRETVQGLSRKLGFYEAGAGGIEAEARYYERVAQVTTEQLMQVAQKYLRPEHAIVTALLPKGTAFTEAHANEALDAAMRGTPHAAPKRKLAPAAPAAMRITSGLSRAGDGELIVEKLSSGATVVVRPEHAVPLFAMRATFLGGLRYETPANNGISTLVARLMTRGTATHDAEQISHLVDELAGSLSAQTGRNSVSLRGEFLSKHFQRAFHLFAECMNHPLFPAGELERERDLLLQDILTREDKPAGVAFELFHKTLYPTHPYRMPTSGEAESVRSLTSAVLADYHAKHLDPSQMTLSVVGDVKLDEVMAFAEQHFGKTRGKAAAPPAIPEEPPLPGPASAQKVLQRAQSHLVLGFRGARVTDPWRRGLEVLSSILSGQGGRLFIELRDKRSMAYSVSSYAVEGIDPGYFAVYIGTSPEKVDAALEGIRAELRKVCDAPVGADELARAKEHLIGTHEIGLQRNGARAAVLALDHCYGLGSRGFFDYAKEIAQVTAEHVQAAARQVVDFERSALSQVGPAT